MSDNDIRDQVIDILTANLGEGVTGIAGDPRYEVDYWPTEILPFDWLLGGGIPAGGSTEICGDYPALKSYVALKAIASVQRRGGLAALIDSEQVFDHEWAESLGVVIEDLFLAYPGTGQLAVAATEALICKGFDLIVWDSLAPTLPQTERNRAPIGARQAGRPASMLSAEMCRLTRAAGNTALLFITQTPANTATTPDGPVPIPGRRTLEPCDALRIRVTRHGKIASDHKTRDGEKEVTVTQDDAYKIKIALEQAKPNKLHRESCFLFDLREAEIDAATWLMDKGLEEGFITRPDKTTWAIPDLDVTVKGQANMRETIATTDRIEAWLTNKIMGYSCC